MFLTLPTTTYKQAYLAAIQDAIGERSETRLQHPEKNESFEEFVQRLNDHAQGKNMQSGYVPASTYWLIDNDEVIGRVQIRHELNAALLKHEGHIGYYIVPSKRRMGYGKKILDLGLQKAKELSITKALVTCDDDNSASARIIEANGGVLENVIEMGEGKPKLRRYWIEIA